MESFGFDSGDEAVVKALAARVIKLETGVDPTEDPQAAVDVIAGRAATAEKSFLEAALRRLGLSLPNRPPQLAALRTIGQVVPGEPVELTAEALDPDGDPLEYRWSCSEGEITGSGPKVTWRAPERDGQYTVAVKVIDGKGGETSGLFSIQVKRVVDVSRLVTIGLALTAVLIALLLIR